MQLAPESPASLSSSEKSMQMPDSSLALTMLFGLILPGDGEKNAVKNPNEAFSRFFLFRLEDVNIFDAFFTGYGFLKSGDFFVDGLDTFALYNLLLIT